VTSNNYAKAKELAAWKEDTAAKWDKFVVEKVVFNGQDITDGSPLSNSNFAEGEDLNVEIVIDKKDMAGDLGVDCVVIEYDTEQQVNKFMSSTEFKLAKKEGSRLYFELKDKAKIPGMCNFAYRIFPKHADMAHRMDFAYVRWI
jgi:starch phosphorylase